MENDGQFTIVRDNNTSKQSAGFDAYNPYNHTRKGTFCGSDLKFVYHTKTSILVQILSKKIKY